MVKRNPRIKDLKGLTFGRLFVANYSHSDSKGKAYWRCLCDCQSETVVRSIDLVRGTVTTCGCGGKFTAYNPRSAESRYWQYKREAKNDGQEFSIDLPRFKEIISSVCHYCGLHADSERLLFLGLDRLDPTGDYVESNVVPCCKVCNFMRHRLSKEDFLFQVHRIYYHQKQIRGRDLHAK